MAYENSYASVEYMKSEWRLSMVARLCHFVISFFRLFAWRYGAAPRRNNAKRKDEITKTPSEITKRRNNARRKDGKTKCATRNDEKRV